jgi:hypothetical protein
MNEDQFAALQAAATDGIDSGWLTVTADEDSYDVTVPDATYRGLTAEELRAVARRHSEYVSEWYFWAQTVPDAPDRSAFLQWLEDGDDDSVTARQNRLREGIDSEWGELSIHAQLAEAGRRVYEIRHVDDADVRVEDLDVSTDPLDARELTKEDDDGRYRPLSTAPTLQRGWALVDLTPAALVRAVDAVYPATITNWHRERDGTLDVTHWTETMGRQSGIYGVIETWDRGDGHEHVEWVATACCDDSQCLKRREWEYDGDTELAAESGDGVFPCREPCSLVISAARRWARLEGEQPRRYEFELTPSEKEQIEAIIDAVADGRADEIREGDFKDDANRWRARYLRAKRMSDGNLCGVETDGED